MPVINNATGLWNVSDYGNTPKFNAGVHGEVFISKSDKNILRKLSGKVLELSSRDIEKEKRKLWVNHNSLLSERPLIFCDPENGWNEIITGNLLKCRGRLARRWEVVLRKEIFWGESMLDDKPIEPVFEIGYTYTDSEWGVQERYHGGTSGRSYAWDAAIKSEEDINSIQSPKIEVDYRTTLKTFSLANEVFNNILKVKIRGVWWWSLGMTWDLARLVGLVKIMEYMYDNPRLLHKIMRILKNGILSKLDYLENNNLLALNNDNAYVGSGGLGYTRDLPRGNLEYSNVKTIDMWGFSESQETVGVSPQMFEEFVFEYQLPIQKRFGLNCYGCCEPLDKRWYIVKNIPNLRRVSVSPWADKRKIAEYLENKYIYSLKPNPADLAVPNMDENLVRKKIKEYLEITKGCVVEIIMKDNHSIGNNPKNITDWVKIAREEINKKYG